jgi:hypothetical protein
LTLPSIKLIGDPVENFYQLGLKDKEHFLPLYTHIKNLSSPKVPLLPEVLEEVAKQFVSTNFYQEHQDNELIKAYAEGLDKPFREVALCTLLPEFLSSMGKWIPELPNNLLGCSSFFFWDEEKNCPGHTRILDFPLIDTFDQNERLINFQFQGQQKIAGFTTAGLPFPSLTSMNEAGVSMALHQKFTDHFDTNGTPIFQLAYELIKKSTSMATALEFLKESRSVTTWCFLLGFPNGDVLVADLSGDKLVYETHNISKGEVLYFNNNPLDQGFLDSIQLPSGISHYNLMRKKSADKKINKIKKDKITAEIFHKVISTPTASKNYKTWSLDVITPSSLSIVTMLADKGEALVNTGNAPKYYNGESILITDLFGKTKQNFIKSRQKKSIQNYINGMRSLMIAQKHFDLNDFNKTYHNLQMAIDQLIFYPEVYIARFYFLALQYCEESHKMIRSQILQDFIELKPFLPDHLQDHTLIFIARLERVLTGETDITENDIKDSYLKSIFTRELIIPALILNKTLKPLINLRIDLLDIIYAHGSRHD